MIKIINSKNLKMNLDLVCTYCGKKHDIVQSKEGIDYVFETDETDEWCICVLCKKHCDGVNKIIEEYNFAKSLGFDSINIVIETTGGEYEISEYEEGFINDNLDGVYSEIDEIASDLYSLIEMNGDKIEGFRIE